MTLCLFVLQGLTITVPLELVGDRGAAVDVVTSADGRICRTHFGDGAPTQEHSGHFLCCIGCLNSRDASAFALAVLFGVVAYSSPKAAISTIRFSMADSGSPPLGWATSWSSRAPPFVS
ncbi:hypothetical protein [Methylosinus sp. Ce-a6]|uniref:hypothetical protein n=1 Tax=Methylosinus sp. Ce-a6 TaxID=2172005 RepID=UPI0013574AEB|nr:hypothetical protein [Methylosinus sp. Ce-a6]